MSAEYRQVEEVEIFLHCDHPACDRTVSIEMEPTDKWDTYVGDGDVDYCPEHKGEYDVGPNAR
jgi:hypothetical protein